MQVVFELVNERDRVIGRQTTAMRPNFRLSVSNNRIEIERPADTINTVTFNGVRADDISDRLTIRIASVNGVAPQNAQFRITALPKAQWDELYCGIFLLKLENSVLMGYKSTVSAAQIAEYRDIAIPSEIFGEPVTSIARGAFLGKQLTSVTIPNSVTSIGSSAFWNNQLTSVIIPAGVTIIEDYAFRNNQLTSVIIPAGVTVIGREAFRNNQLTSVTIPAGITSIGAYAFEENQLASVTIPAGVTVIGRNAFRNNQLTNVTIPASVITIEDNTFEENRLASVTISNGVTTIKSGAFRNNQLAGVTIPNSVRTVEYGAFLRNPLTSITIGTDVRFIKLQHTTFGSFPEDFERTYNGVAGTYTAPPAGSPSGTPWTRR